MYVRPDGRRRTPNNIPIPQNYSGNAFSEKEDSIIDSEADSNEKSGNAEPISNEVASFHIEEKHGFLSGIANSDDLIILGLILLLSQDGFGDDMLPLILIILLFRK